MSDIPRIPEHVRACRSQLRTALPADAFSPEPARLAYLVLHGAVILLGAFVVAATEDWWIWALVTLLAGQSFAALGFLAHDLAHGTIVRRSWLRYAFEVLAWSPLLVSATLWRITHHRAHHLGPNTAIDQDRKPSRVNLGASERAFYGAFYPYDSRWKFNPLIGLHFVAFIARLTIALLFWNERRMPSMQCALSASRREWLLIWVEIGAYSLLQFAAFVALGSRLDKLFFATLAPLGVGSAMATIYLVTNHFLRGHQKDNDPLASSTSIIVPWWMDALHSHFSYHVEHHLFPDVRSRYYPILARELQTHFAQDYHRLKVTEAWRLLLSGPLWQLGVLERNGDALASPGRR